jgi:hypothetical protein
MFVGNITNSEKGKCTNCHCFCTNRNSQQFLMVFINLKAGGINMDNFAVFCDRGKQMLAHNCLVNFGTTWLHLKNCTLHIARNVCAKFSPNDDHLNFFMFQLQSTKSLIEYINVLIKITSQYYKPVEIIENVTTINDIINNSIMKYIMELHPTQNSVMGNINLSSEGKNLIKHPHH